MESGIRHNRGVHRFLLICLVLLVGCDGGVDCPLDPPACCYNSLFGCGTFDLPQGCSCSRYGLSRSLPRRASLSRTKVVSLGGVWRGTLTKASSSCRNVLSQVRGSYRVTERSGRVVVTIPGMGTLSGRRTPGGFVATGRYQPIFLLCPMTINATYGAKTQSFGGISVAISRRCSERATSCEMLYRGSSRR